MRRVRDAAPGLKRIEEGDRAEDHHEDPRRDRDDHHDQDGTFGVVQGERQQQPEERA